MQENKISCDRCKKVMYYAVNSEVKVKQLPSFICEIDKVDTSAGERHFETSYHICTDCKIALTEFLNGPTE